MVCFLKDGRVSIMKSVMSSFFGSFSSFMSFLCFFSFFKYCSTWFDGVEWILEIFFSGEAIWNNFFRIFWARSSIFCSVEISNYRKTCFSTNYTNCLINLKNVYDKIQANFEGWWKFISISENLLVINFKGKRKIVLADSWLVE